MDNADDTVSIYVDMEIMNSRGTEITRTSSGTISEYDERLNAPDERAYCQYAGCSCRALTFKRVDMVIHNTWLFHSPECLHQFIELNKDYEL